MSDRLIYHVFADDGVESEYLTRFGRVVRVGLNPADRNGSEVVKADANRLPLKPGADLVVLHPECGPWNTICNNLHDNADEYPEQVELAREIGREYGEHYIIENVPNAPLNDPVILEGSYFGLPITKRRAFETSFHVPQPELQQTLTDHVNNFDRYERPREWWETVMGVSNFYPIDGLVNSGMPRAYIEYLLRYYFLETEEATAEASGSARVAADGSGFGGEL